MKGRVRMGVSEVGGYFQLAVALSAEDVAWLEVAVVIVWLARRWVWRKSALSMA